MSKYLVLLILLILAGKAYAFDDQEVINNSTLAISFNASHFMGVYEDIDPSSNFGISLSKELNKKLRANFSQSFTKLYVIDPGDSEFRLQDSVLSLSYFKSSSTIVNLSLSAPISDYSRFSGLITSLGASVNYRKFFGGRILLSLTPFLRYNFNSYKSDPDSNILTQARIGANFTTGYAVSQRMFVTASASFGVGFQEKLVYQKSDDVSDNGFYAFNFAANYRISQKVSLNAGYSQGGTQINQGVREIYLYDPYNSSYFLGTSVIF